MLPTGARGPKVVAFGGGHGLYATLSALRHVTGNLTAVVTVADDGGSSGRLRSELGILPPGDLRMALSALCDDGEWGQMWRDVLQHRYATDGPLNNHATGNLLIASVWNLLGDNAEGLDFVGRLLGVHGRVLPMSDVPMEIEADVHDNGLKKIVRGQSKVAIAPGRVEKVRLFPSDATAHPAVLDAIADADWAVFGPGSWYTSVIPHLMLPDIRRALAESSAKTLLALNLTSDEETSDMCHADHIKSFISHSAGLRPDVVIADPTAIDDLTKLDDSVTAIDASLILRQIHTLDDPGVHDPLRFAAALRDAFEGTIGDLADKR